MTNKYGNHRTTVNGHSFASKREAKRYQELCLLEKAGHISALECQTRFPLKIDGELICTYVADFSYLEGGKTVTEDCKGFKTPEYKLKAKLMKAIHGIEILET